MSMILPPVELASSEITWNVTKVNADDVWAQYDITGEGVIVALIDSGVNYDHADIADNMWDGGTDFPHHGWDFVNNDNDPKDDHGHGSHCAGIIAGYGTSGSKTGVAPGAKIMAIKTLDSNISGNSSRTIQAIEFALEHGADILSMSIGATGGGYAPYRNAMVTANSAGVVASVAAGNSGNKLSEYPIPKNIKSPGNCPPPWLHPDQANVLSGGLSAVVCVGSTDSTDIIAPSSSYGPATWSNIGSYNDYPYTSESNTEIGLIRPDVAAPGVSIVSLSHSSNTGYATKSGTSMATPCVAGVMALLLQANPSLTPALIDKAIETTAVQCGGYTSKNNRYGSGRVDALAAIQTIGYPITLYGNDTVMRVVYASQDYPVDIPDATPVNDYEFFGWSLSNVSPTQTEPNIVNAEGYAPSSSTELYAVYRIAVDETDYWYSTSITAVSGELVNGTILPNGFLSGAVVIPEGATVVCEDGFVNTDPANLVVEEGGQLIVNNAGIQATVKKGVVAPSRDSDHWYTISSPVNHIASDSVTNLILNGEVEVYDLYEYDEPSMSWFNSKSADHGNDFDYLTNGRGYLYYSSTGADLEFPGEMNYGEIVYRLTKTDSAGAFAGFNLIGNPYSHNIYKGAGTAIESENLAEGFYMLSNSSAWVAQNDNDSAIVPGEGVLVKATSTFDLTITDNSSGGNTRAGHGFVRIDVDNAQYHDVAYIVNSSNEGLDKINHRNGCNPMLYIPQDGTNYAIVTCQGDVNEMPLCFKAGVNGTYTLSVAVKGLDADYLHLIDHVTGADVDLLSTPSYTFEARKTDYAARFRIVFSQEAPVSDGESFAYMNGASLIVENTGAAMLQVVDLTGRVMRCEEIHGCYNGALDLKAGIYVVSLIGADKVRTQKIVVE